MKKIVNKILYYLMLPVAGLFLTGCGDDESPSLPNETGDPAIETELRDAVEAAGGTAAFTMPASDDYANIPQDPLNPLTAEKVQLGQFLFHETGLATNPKLEFSKGTFSCASCHFAGAGFQAGRVQGIADGGIGFGRNGEGRVRGALYEGDSLDVQPIRTPTNLNIAFQELTLWNGQFGATGANEAHQDKFVGFPLETNLGGFQGPEVQAIAGLQVHRMPVDNEFFTENPEYRDLFDAAFPDRTPADRYGREAAGLAIAAYERVVLANGAPFQEWLRGKPNALTDQEKLGAVLFLDKANCVSCHSGPSLSDGNFHAIGMGDLDVCPEEIFQTTSDLPVHLGRGAFTGNSADNYKFKTPQLYNLTDSPFYGHGSSHRSLESLVRFKNEGVSENDRVPTTALSDAFVSLELSGEEVNALVAFLKHGLHDDNLLRYQPAALPSGNCFPNADPLSKSQLGCD